VLGSACAARRSTPTLRAGRCAVCSLHPNRAICIQIERFAAPIGASTEVRSGLCSRSIWLAQLKKHAKFGLHCTLGFGSSFQARDETSARVSPRWLVSCLAKAHAQGVAKFRSTPRRTRKERGVEVPRWLRCRVHSQTHLPQPPPPPPPSRNQRHARHARAAHGRSFGQLRAGVRRQAPRSAAKA